jgi:hypothetical protein
VTWRLIIYRCNFSAKFSNFLFNVGEWSLELPHLFTKMSLWGEFTCDTSKDKAGASAPAPLRQRGRTVIKTESAVGGGAAVDRMRGMADKKANSSSDEEGMEIEPDAAARADAVVTVDSSGAVSRRIGEFRMKFGGGIGRTPCGSRNLGGGFGAVEDSSGHIESEIVPSFAQSSRGSATFASTSPLSATAGGGGIVYERTAASQLSATPQVAVLVGGGGSGGGKCGRGGVDTDDGMMEIDSTSAACRSSTRGGGIAQLVVTVLSTLGS